MFKALALAFLFFTPTAFATIPACKNAKCPLNYVRCEEGKKRIDVRAPGSCCPKWKCVEANTPDCSRVKCAKGKPTCEDTQILVDKAEEGSCCPDWECMDDETEEL